MKKETKSEKDQAQAAKLGTPTEKATKPKQKRVAPVALVAPVAPQTAKPEETQDMASVADTMRLLFIQSIESHQKTCEVVEAVWQRARQIAFLADAVHSASDPDQKNDLLNLLRQNIHRTEQDLRNCAEVITDGVDFDFETFEAVEAAETPEEAVEA